MLQTFPIILFCTSQNLSPIILSTTPIILQNIPALGPVSLQTRVTLSTPLQHTQGGTLNLSRIVVPELQLGASLLEIESRSVLLVVLDCTDSPLTDMFKVETRGVINLFPYALRLFPHYSRCHVRPIIPKIMPA